MLLAYLDQDSGIQYNYYTIPKGVLGTTLLAMYFGHSLHALLHSDIAGQLPVLMGLICMVNIEVLMIAMATNANQKVLPLAFAVVDKELGPSWGSFLECLKISIRYVIPDDANQKVLPLTFVVVEKELGPSWGSFLECLRISFVW